MNEVGIELLGQLKNLHQKMTCLDGIGRRAGEGDEIDGIGSVPSLPVQPRTCPKLARSWGECEVGRGLVQPGSRVKCQYWVIWINCASLNQYISGIKQGMYWSDGTCMWSLLSWELNRRASQLEPPLQMLSLIINIMTLPPSPFIKWYSGKNMVGLHLSWTAVVNWVGLKTAN